MIAFDEGFYVEKTIAVSPEKAWEIISTPEGLMHWHPFIKTNTAESWNGVGSKDHLLYNSGFEFTREVVNWLEGEGYDLKVTENGKRENKAIWRIIPIDENHCTLRITGRVEFIKSWPFPIRWFLIKFKMKPVFSQYLFQILEGFAYYAETGKQVQSDQFGSHPMFSKKC
ncbi:SRPBCC family protein [Paraferrimonas haliotis]|uniref:SRPBCC family protein n=1 Tax=Paraferrimonas haliotis TaxID=2013866 RepID=A0AA37TRG0_9GAMM|nr:SRPBCC family protein [Paraferrimonas haliotis]GLS84308.1 hypothetical protein GCM10007894_22850 [Paraferrimonas haliotis]